MTNPAYQLADAIRAVSVAMQKSIDDGHRSRMINAEDLVEVLLTIADRLDPPVQEPNRVAFPCVNCAENDEDRLEWQDDEFVRCSTCGTIYAPGN